MTSEAISEWGPSEPSHSDAGVTNSTAKVAIPALDLGSKSENYDKLAFSCALDLESAAISMNDEIDAMLQRSRYLVNKQETRHTKLIHRFRRSDEDLDEEIRNIDAALEDQEEAAYLADRNRLRNSRGLAHIQTLLDTAPSLARNTHGTTSKSARKKIRRKEDGKTKGHTTKSTPVLVQPLSSASKARAFSTAPGSQKANLSKTKVKTKKKLKSKKGKANTKKALSKQLAPVVRGHASENYVTCFEERDQLLAALDVSQRDRRSQFETI